MTRITTIGLDLAKKVFQVHGVDAEGKVVVARKLRRKEVLAFFAKLAPCLVGMEACGSAHYWAREIAKLGHTVKLMPPKYVKAYVKRGKTDPGDAEGVSTGSNGRDLLQHSRFGTFFRFRSRRQPG
jgi:transposase